MNNDLPAFPNTDNIVFNNSGLSKIEYFSGQCLQAIIVGVWSKIDMVKDKYKFTEEYFAKCAVSQAMALMKELEKI